MNNVVSKQLKHDSTIKVTKYKIEDYKSRPTAYEKHHANYGVKTSSSADSIKFLKGDYLIELNQPNNRYIIEMLEPTGDDSFFAWNFFDAVLQQKEGYSDYRWEDIAEKVLNEDLLLKAKLEAKKAAEPSFAKNAPAILEFIYKNSKWLEKEFMTYPIYRIEN